MTSKIDPWRTLQIDQLKLAASLIDPDKHLHRWLIHAQGTIGGAVAVATPGFMAPTSPCWPSCPTSKDKELAQRCYAGWNICCRQSQQPMGLRVILQHASAGLLCQ